LLPIFNEQQEGCNGVHPWHIKNLNANNNLVEKCAQLDAWPVHTKAQMDYIEGRDLVRKT
jgi:hypothetical protein